MRSSSQNGRSSRREDSITGKGMKKLLSDGLTDLSIRREKSDVNGKAFLKIFKKFFEIRLVFAERPSKKPHDEAENSHFQNS